MISNQEELHAFIVDLLSRKALFLLPILQEVYNMKKQTTPNPKKPIPTHTEIVHPPVKSTTRKGLTGFVLK